MKTWMLITVIWISLGFIRGPGGDVECTASDYEVNGWAKRPVSESIHYTPLRGSGGIQWVKVR